MPENYPVLPDSNPAPRWVRLADAIMSTKFAGRMVMLAGTATVAAGIAAAFKGQWVAGWALVTAGSWTAFMGAAENAPVVEEWD